MRSYSSELFEENIEEALGETIESIRARPLDPRTDLNAGRFGNPPKLDVPVWNSKTGRYTDNLREVFPDPNIAYEEALKIIDSLS